MVGSGVLLIPEYITKVIYKSITAVINFFIVIFLSQNNRTDECFFLRKKPPEGGFDLFDNRQCLPVISVRAAG